MNKNLKEELIMQLATELHDKWRNRLKMKEDWTFEPKIKKTKDKKWIKKNGKDEVDIANTSFVDLPTDWQKENYDAAKLVIDLVYDEVINLNKKGYDLETIEELSSKVHDSWMERNSWKKVSKPELFVPYEELPEKEKAKDRVQIIDAIKKVATRIIKDQNN